MAVAAARAPQWWDSFLVAQALSAAASAPLTSYTESSRVSLGAVRDAHDELLDVLGPLVVCVGRASLRREDAGVELAVARPDLVAAAGR